jgi:putative ABC transport system permease protein
MAHWRVLVRKYLAIFRRRRDDDVLEEEIALHLRLLEERFRSRGLSAAEAGREARLAFGGVQQLREAHFDERAVPWLAEAAQDAAYAWRMLRRQPGFATAAVLTLALGIGANAAVFSAVNGVILRPLSYPAVERVERIGWSWNDRSPATGAIAPFKFAYLREHSSAFEALATWQLSTVETMDATPPMRVLRASEDFLDVVGGAAAMGRGFTPEEHALAASVAVLTERGWRARFGSDPGVVGRSIVVGDRLLPIVGVLSSSFEFPEVSDPVDVIVPLALRPDPSDLGANSPAIGRLHAGVTRAGAQADVDRVFAQLRRERPGQMASADERGVLMSFAEVHLSGVTRPLWTLLAGVSVVLLIACTNVANLLLARGSTRLREMAVRGALGASRGRLLRQGITEGLVIAAIGGAAGIAIAAVALRLLINLAPAGIARLNDVRIDGTVLGVAVAAVVVIGSVFGLAAAGAGTLPAIAGVSSLTTRGSSLTRRGRRLRQLLIGLQSALAMLLVVGAVLLVSGFYRLTQMPLGFDPQGLVAVTFPRVPAASSSPERLATTVRGLRESLSAVPGVEVVAMTNVAPLAERGYNMPMTVEGNPDATEGAVEFREVSREYAAAMGLRLLKGRWFSDDDIATDQPVIVVTANLAARYFPDADAIGQRVLVGVFRGQRRSGGAGPAREIIGIVDDLRDLGPTRTIRRTMFVPPPRAAASLPAFLVLTAGPVPREKLRAAAQAADTALPEAVVTTMAERLSSRLTRDRFSSLLMTVFAAVALVMTAIGVFGVVSWIVRHATHELGIRIALGASRRRVLRDVLLPGVAPVVAGLAAGGAAALTASGLFDGLVVGATTVSAPITTGAAAVLLIAAGLAAVIPARRAVQVDPAVALRAD